jgi:hypothetical protein
MSHHGFKIQVFHEVHGIVKLVLKSNNTIRVLVLATAATLAAFRLLKGRNSNK